VNKFFCFTFCFALIIVSANSAAPARADDAIIKAHDMPSLKSEFAGYFRIGTAVSKNQIMNGPPGLLDFVANQFNAITAENEMKWERIHPEKGRYDWQPADELVKFSQANDIYLTGHTLIWHQQTPDWVFEDDNGNPASRELLLERMQDHINTVVGHFDGAVPSWDVVNEALNDDGTMRVTKWQQIIGNDFVEKAFEYAHQADPNAQLYYNDYSLYKPEKRDGAVRLVKHLQAKGIPVHGIGMQGHYGLGHPENLKDVEDSILAFAELGDVMITEFDISVLPSPGKDAEGADLDVNVELAAKYNPYTDGLPEDIAQAQGKRFVDLFRIFLAHQDKISRVTFWGVSDGDNWKNNWPMQGRTDYPLLIDRDYQLKPVTNELFKLIEDYPLP
jgi:endo-1,4-beta-xylanase